MPFSALYSDTTDGVAVPSTTTASDILPRSTAASIVSYFGVISDLYDASCSSSIIMAPRSSNGAYIPDLAPISILAPPVLTRIH